MHLSSTQSAMMAAPAPLVGHLVVGAMHWALGVPIVGAVFKDLGGVLAGATGLATVAQVAATAVEEAADLDQAMGDVASTRQGDNQSKVVIQECQVC